MTTEQQGEWELELSFTVDNMGDWTKGSDFFEKHLEAQGWCFDSAGTGGGERDMTFTRATAATEEELQQLRDAATAEGIKLLGVSCYQPDDEEE